MTWGERTPPPFSPNPGVVPQMCSILKKKKNKGDLQFNVKYLLERVKLLLRLMFTSCWQFCFQNEPDHYLEEFFGSMQLLVQGHIKRPAFLPQLEILSTLQQYMFCTLQQCMFCTLQQCTSFLAPNLDWVDLGVKVNVILLIPHWSHIQPTTWLCLGRQSSVLQPLAAPTGIVPYLKKKHMVHQLIPEDRKYIK